MSATFTLKHIDSGKEFQIPQNSSLIGRSANCDITVEAETLSREHARISRQDNELTLQDLHSTNGSFVNDNQIFEQVALQPGDILRFGQERFSLTSSERDATIMISRRDLESDSAMLIEDEEESDATMMIQAIDLPQGWDSHASQEATENQKDAALIEALKKHAKNKLKQRFGLLITISSEDSAPAVKLLSPKHDTSTWAIGRTSSADIQLNDQTVSENHARIEYNEGKWKIVDNKSRNGTLINKRKTSEYAVQQAVSVQIGSYNLALEPIEA
jgi:pSer/pThr/pTyr-binding forkhead associated (FHA) protein